MASPTCSPAQGLRVFLSSDFVDVKARWAIGCDVVGSLGRLALAAKQFGVCEPDG
jgi:hypothetical protein